MTPHLFEFIFSIKRKCLSTEERIQKHFGLSHAEFHALLALKENEPIPANGFARLMGLSASRASRVLWRLVSRGFVQSSTDARDRRSVAILLTPQGTTMKENCETQMIECENRILDALKPDEVENIRQSLASLDRVL